MNSDLVEWKCCRTCRVLMPRVQNFGYKDGRVRKDGTRKRFYRRDCFKCEYAKKNPNARPRRSVAHTETEAQMKARLKELMANLTPALHPYL